MAKFVSLGNVLMMFWFIMDILYSDVVIFLF